MFILLFMILVAVAWLQFQSQTRPVQITDILTQLVLMAMPIWLTVTVMAIFFWVIPWLARPWMIKHIRRSICDLGYDEGCHRCGYRLAGLPWKRVQCPECGAIRARPRPLPKSDMESLTNR